MTTGVDELDSRIRDLTKREKECDGLFEEIKKGNGEKSLQYLTLRDSCNELKREIVRSAISAGLTRERIRSELGQQRSSRKPAKGQYLTSIHDRNAERENSEP